MAEKILFGLMGENLDHSASPLIFNRYFQRLNLNCFYHTYPVSPESLADLLAKIRTSAVAGLNVTIPFKEKIIPHLDEIDQKAEE
ncbi:MAG: shikimate dehydrogenase family protein, partial [Candidatus Aminicenantes bacterium]